MTTNPLLKTAAAALLVLILLYGTGLLLLIRIVDEFTLETAGQIGESLGVIGLLLNGAAVLLVVWTVRMQQSELELQRDEMSRLVAAQSRQLHGQLVELSLNDPDLLVVWGEFPDEPSRQKRNMYIKLTLDMWRSAYVQNVADNKNYINGLLRIYMSRSSYFRDYWEIRREQRLALAAESRELTEFERAADEAYNAALAADTSDEPT